MKDIILSKLRVPGFTSLDVMFLCKRYIGHMPNMIHYEKLLDDVESLNNDKISNTEDHKNICDYIRKACISNKKTLEEHFAKFKSMRDSISQ